MSRFSEALLPERLGPGFRWIWSSTTAANLGDGVLLSAGPLLVASITREPFAVALALFVQRLPWLLFGVLAGAVIDRLDRRRLLVGVYGFRVVVLGALAVGLALGEVTLPIIYGTMFLIGTAETVADNASSTLVAMTVPPDGLGLANARLHGAQLVTNQMAGPPLGAVLFGVAAALPFGFNAASFAIAMLLVARAPIRQAAPSQTAGASLRADIAEGWRWLWGHPPVRTLALMITVFNITFGAAFSVLVLYAYERLGLDDFGFGLLMTAMAVGGLVGSVIFRRLEERFTYARLLRVGLIIETLTHAVLALTTSAVVAVAVMILFGIHAVVWGTTSTTVRMRAVPSPLLGRVTSVYLIGSVGAIALGTLLGGALAQQWGILAPLWFAFAGSAVMTALIWRAMANVAHAAEVGEDDGTVAPTAIRPAPGPE